MTRISRLELDDGLRSFDPADDAPSTADDRRELVRRIVSDAGETGRAVDLTGTADHDVTRKDQRGSRRHVPIAIVAALVLLVALTFAGARVLRGQPAPGPIASPSARPTPLFAPDGKPLLIADTTVIDEGRGPELCAGGVLQSLPPHCSGGVPLRGWVWPESGTENDNRLSVHPRDSSATPQPVERDAQGRVRLPAWGDFDVVGTYDGSAFTVAKVVTQAQAAASLPVVPDLELANRCPDPPDGWSAPDATRTSDDDRDRLIDVAGHLPDFTDVWAAGENSSGQPMPVTVMNVQVAGDPAVAERRLRQVWGGPLCVSVARYTNVQRAEVFHELADRHTFLSMDLTVEHVGVGVVYDDGALQRQLDARYGVGMVAVHSSLRPYLG